MVKVSNDGTRPRTLGYGAYLTVHREARSVKLYIPTERDRCSGAKRGRVRRFSHASRKRMMERIHRVKQTAALPHFVTLTFPDFFPDQKTAKRRLDTLFKRWKRRWPNTAAIWRMEVINRKSGANAGQVAPHFHLLVWGQFDGKQAAQDWFEVNGSSDYAHLKHGTDAEPLESWRGAVSYCAKYCAKSDDAFETDGRVWGVHNRDAMPEDRAPVKVPLSPRQAWSFRRIVRRYFAAAFGRRIRMPATIFTDSPEKWWGAGIL
jgi:hypothetical protein